MEHKKNTSSKEQNYIGPPHKRHTFAEGLTTLRHAFMLKIHRPAKDRSVPKGDGHPVLLLPGVMASDISMYPLKKFLNKINYNADTWGGGRNKGALQEHINHIIKRVEDMYEESGGQKVSLIGWSLGGVFAREVAFQCPDKVRDVILLGSPHKGIETTEDTVFDGLIKRFNLKPNQDITLDSTRPIKQPMTSIYAKKDGVVHWRACLLPENDQTENIEVNASHLSLGYNAQTWRVIAGRLAEPEGAWKRSVQLPRTNKKRELHKKK